MDPLAGESHMIAVCISRIGLFALVAASWSCGSPGRNVPSPVVPTPATPDVPASAIVEGLVATWTGHSMVGAPNATVTLVDAHGMTASTVTSAQGAFNFPSPAGFSFKDATLTAVKEGFEPETASAPSASGAWWWENLALVPAGTSHTIRPGDVFSSEVASSDAPCSNSIAAVNAEGSWPFEGPCQRFRFSASVSGTLVAELHWAVDNKTKWEPSDLYLALVPWGVHQQSGGARFSRRVDGGSTVSFAVALHAGSAPAPFTLSTSLELP
jgi:hypothetical protein